MMSMPMVKYKSVCLRHQMLQNAILWIGHGCSVGDILFFPSAPPTGCHRGFQLSPSPPPVVFTMGSPSNLDPPLLLSGGCFHNTQCTSAEVSKIIEAVLF